MTMSFEAACAEITGPGTLFEITRQDIKGIPLKVFASAPPSLGALYGLASLRTDTYITYEDETWEMPDFMELAGQIGHVLVEHCGVSKGDRVAIAMRNYPEWVASFVAITSIGAVAVPLNAWWQTGELNYALDDSGATVVLADTERLARIEASEPGTVSARVLVVRHEDPLPDTDFIVEKLEDVLVEGATMPVVEVGAEDNATILYTSGTTGNPKGALSCHRAVVHALMSFAARAQVAELCAGVPASETNSEAADGVAAPEPPQPVFMLSVPLFHVTGLVPVMLGSMISGARLVMLYRWDPNRALELIEAEKVTTFVGVPTMALDLLEAEKFAETDTSSLLSIGGGGAPMPARLVERIETEFGNGRPGLGYGMTETNAYGPQITGDEFIARPLSTGRPVPIMDLKITDEDGTPLGPEETGEIWFRGPNLINGYWNQPEATNEAIVDGWLRSGDIGWMDADGYLYISDRLKDMVLRGGENIYCAEVEAAIYEHAAVYEAAVYGVADDRLGEDLACHVMVKPGESLDKNELRSFLAERLAKFKVPTFVTLVDEPLPRNASGKILKRELRPA